MYQLTPSPAGSESCSPCSRCWVSWWGAWLRGCLWSAPQLSADMAQARHLRAVCVPGSRAEQVLTAGVARQGSCPVCPSVCPSPCLWLLLCGGLGGVGGEGGRCLLWQLRVPAVRVLRGQFLAQPEMSPAHTACCVPLLCMWAARSWVPGRTYSVLRGWCQSCDHVLKSLY